MLDTNVPSELLRPRPDINVLVWIQQQMSEAVFVSVVKLGELCRGTALLTEQSTRRVELERLMLEKIPAWFGDRVLPVSRGIAERWGALDAEQQLAGRPLNIADGLIAATALSMIWSSSREMSETSQA